VTRAQLKTRLRNSLVHPRGLAHRELQRIVATVGPRLRGRLLDVGCGSKPYTEVLTAVESYVGLDTAATMHGLERVDVVGTAFALPFRGCRFDSVLCTEVLEHTPEPLAVLQEIWRVTKPGGLLLLTVPMSEQLHEEPADFYRFTHYGARYLLIKAGFQVREVYERGGPWLELGYRTSSLLYSTLGARRDDAGRLHARPLVGPLVVAVCLIVQAVALAVDRLWKPPLSTIGYALLAERPLEAAS
jgi:SAM-dependent methyltransferase